MDNILSILKRVTKLADINVLHKIKTELLELPYVYDVTVDEC